MPDRKPRGPDNDNNRPTEESSPAGRGLSIYQFILQRPEAVPACAEDAAIVPYGIRNTDMLTPGMHATRIPSRLIPRRHHDDGDAPRAPSSVNSL